MTPPLIQENPGSAVGYLPCTYNRPSLFQTMTNHQHLSSRIVTVFSWQKDLRLATTLKIGVDVVIKMFDVPISTCVPIRTYIGTQLVALFGELMEIRKGSLSGGSGTIWWTLRFYHSASSSTWMPHTPAAQLGAIPPPYFPSHDAPYTLKP